MSDQTLDEDFECIKGDLLEVLRHELGGWDLDPKLLRKAFTAAVAELVDSDFAGKQTPTGTRVS